MFAAFLALILASPFLVLLASVFRGLVLFFPTMLMFGVVHDFLPVVPAFGWGQTLAIVVLTTLLFSTSSTSSSTSSR